MRTLACLLLPICLAAPVAAAIDDAQRAAAARTTAESHRACVAIQPFYWEIGRAGGKIVGDTSGGSSPTRDTPMLLASATKLLYAAYVVERRGGKLTADDIRALSLRSGYTGFGGCERSDTIGRCLATASNGVHNAAHDGKFYYDGGHMQHHAADAAGMALAALDSAAFGAELRGRLGNDSGIDFALAQPAGGGRGSAAGYARVLQKVVAGELRMRDWLGKNAVHTHPGRYPDEAMFTPAPLNESWSYSIGHWIEDDPTVGDGAFSSPGLYGFYPWIDAGRTTYGIVARAVLGGIASSHPGFQPAFQSAVCGWLIRKAWFSGRPPA